MGGTARYSAVVRLFSVLIRVPIIPDPERLPDSVDAPDLHGHARGSVQRHRLTEDRHRRSLASVSVPAWTLALIQRDSPLLADLAYACAAP